jgi:hypothetical protein
VAKILTISKFLAQLGLVWQLYRALHPTLPTSWGGVFYFFVLAISMTIIKYSYKEFLDV